MFTLSLKSEPYWMDLPRGVQVQVLPARSSLMEAVREEIFAAPPLTDDDDDERAERKITYLDWAKALARHAIIAWEGVGDEDGQPVEPSPEFIEAMLEEDKIFTAWRDAYVIPALKVSEEGND